jgi:transglutaminase-like putative cysteine protease
MLIRIGYDIELAVTAPLALLWLLRVHPSRERDLVAPEHPRIEPALPTDEWLDTFGNRCTRLRVPSGVAAVRLRNRALLRDDGAPDPVDPQARQRDPAELPPATLPFVLPSRYCEVDSELMDVAWRGCGQLPPGWARVQAVCDLVHARLRFDYAAARATRTAKEAWHERAGVCRDFAHLAITLCRCLNVPARYTTGYLGDIGVRPLPDPMDFSAWFEAWLGDRWYAFDARHNAPRIGRVVIARGRDAADVPITMAFGDSRVRSFRVITEEVVEAAQPA